MIISDIFFLFERISLPLPNETAEQKDLIIKAKWNDDCSFEAESEKEEGGKVIFFIG